MLDAVRSAPAPPPPLPSPVKGEGDLLPPSPAAGGGQGEGGIIVSPNANLTAFRLVDGAVEMRLHECCGESSTAHMGLPFEPASATLTDFLGKPMPGTVRVSGRHIELDLSPWQIVTVRLARALAG